MRQINEPVTLDGTDIMTILQLARIGQRALQAKDNLSIVQVIDEHISDELKHIKGLNEKGMEEYLLSLKRFETIIHTDFDHGRNQNAIDILYSMWHALPASAMLGSIGNVIQEVQYKEVLLEKIVNRLVISDEDGFTYIGGVDDPKKLVDYLNRIPEDQNKEKPFPRL